MKRYRILLNFTEIEAEDMEQAIMGIMESPDFYIDLVEIGEVEEEDEDVSDSVTP